MEGDRKETGDIWQRELDIGEVIGVWNIVYLEPNHK